MPALRIRDRRRGHERLFQSGIPPYKATSQPAASQTPALRQIIE